MTGALAILGGCGGIGRTLQRQADAGGWTPHILDRPEALAAHPPPHPAHEIDATDPASVDASARALPSELSGLVALAGHMGAPAPVTEDDARRWSELIDINLTATWRVVAALHARLKDGAAIVLAGSGLGHRARPGYGAYAIAKAGIAALTRQLALELAPRLRVNAVAPNAVDTAFLRGGTGRPRTPPRLDADAYAATIPLGRIARPEDVAGPILFLLSPAAAYVTGQVLHVNGGAHMP